MGRYVDGYVIAIAKRNLPAYRKLARLGAKIWREHGALELRECVGEDLTAPCGVPFPKLVRAKKGETVIFSWVVYRSRAHRDRVNGKVMTDPRLAHMSPKTMPFDMKRMTVGGFEVMVETVRGRR